MFNNEEVKEEEFWDESIFKIPPINNVSKFVSPEVVSPEVVSPEVVSPEVVSSEEVIEFINWVFVCNVSISFLFVVVIFLSSPF